MKALRVATAVWLMLLAGCATLEGNVDAARSELAPTGKMRVAVVSNNPNYLKQPASPPYEGIAVDIGNAISRKVGVPMELVVYPNQTALLADATTGKWDVILTGIEESRRAYIDYSPAYAVTQNTFLVPAGSALMTIPDVDRKGIRVAASQNTMQLNHLQKTLRQATLVPVQTVAASTSELQAGRVEALAANRPTIERLASQMPGYRARPGSFMDVEYGVGVPKGRRAAAAQVAAVVQEMRASGAMAEVLKRAGVQGLNVPSY